MFGSVSDSLEHDVFAERAHKLKESWTHASTCEGNAERMNQSACLYAKFFGSLACPLFEKDRIPKIDFFQVGAKPLEIFLYRLFFSIFPYSFLVERHSLSKEIIGLLQKLFKRLDSSFEK